MPEVRCTVNNCHYWDDGNVCAAEAILVISDDAWPASASTTRKSAKLAIHRPGCPRKRAATRFARNDAAGAGAQPPASPGLSGGIARFRIDILSTIANTPGGAAVLPGEIARSERE